MSTNDRKDEIDYQKYYTKYENPKYIVISTNENVMIIVFVKCIKF